jgi:hypothetical protein
LQREKYVPRAEYDVLRTRVDVLAACLQVIMPHLSKFLEKERYQSQICSSKTSRNIIQRRKRPGHAGMAMYT